VSLRSFVWVYISRAYARDELRGLCGAGAHACVYVFVFLQVCKFPSMCFCAYVCEEVSLAKKFVMDSVHSGVCMCMIIYLCMYPLVCVVLCKLVQGVREGHYLRMKAYILTYMHLSCWLVDIHVCARVCPCVCVFVCVCVQADMLCYLGFTCMLFPGLHILAKLAYGYLRGCLNAHVRECMLCALVLTFKHMILLWQEIANLAILEFLECILTHLQEGKANGKGITGSK
jgi:hypothetical protein